MHTPGIDSHKLKLLAECGCHLLLNRLWRNNDSKARPPLVTDGTRHRGKGGPPNGIIRKPCQEEQVRSELIEFLGKHCRAHRLINDELGHADRRGTRGSRSQLGSEVLASERNEHDRWPCER